MPSYVVFQNIYLNKYREYVFAVTCMSMNAVILWILLKEIKEILCMVFGGESTQKVFKKSDVFMPVCCKK